MADALAVAVPVEVQVQVEAGVRFCQSLVDIADGVVVATDGEYADLGAVLRKLSSVEKELDGQRDAAVRPMNAQVRAINDAFRRPLSHVEMLRVKLKRLMADYQAARAAEQRRLLEAAAAAAEAARAALGPRSMEPAQPAPAVAALVVQAAAAAAPQVDGISMRSRWVWTVVDLALVPRQYLAVDTGAVQQAIKAGVHEIPGLKIEQVTEVAARAG